MASVSARLTVFTQNRGNQVSGKTKGAVSVTATVTSVESQLQGEPVAGTDHALDMGPKAGGLVIFHGISNSPGSLSKTHSRASVQYPTELVLCINSGQDSLGRVCIQMVLSSA